MSACGPKEGGETEWFVSAFDELYLELYAHRDENEARVLIRTLGRRFALKGPVLDLACGPGRFLRALEAEGMRGIGLDLSRPLLRHALASAPAGETRLIRGDMRSLPLRTASLSWVLLLFTSFGYFVRGEEDRAVLAEIARALAPGGTLVLDFLNAGPTVRELVPDSRREVGGRTIRETRWVDPAGPFLRKRVELGEAGRGGPAVTHEERVRLYTPAELIDLLSRADFDLLARWGDYAGGVFSEETSPRCLLLARRREA